MEKIINYENELYVIETDDMDKTLNHLKDRNISECLIYDLQNKNLRSYYNKHISINPIYPDKEMSFSYGKRRDKYANILIENGIERITVWTKQNPKSRCIYDSRAQITYR